MMMIILEYLKRNEKKVNAIYVVEMKTTKKSSEAQKKIYIYIYIYIYNST